MQNNECDEEFEALIARELATDTEREFARYVQDRTYRSRLSLVNLTASQVSSVYDAIDRFRGETDQED